MSMGFDRIRFLRRAVATTCQTVLKYGIPTDADGIDDVVNKAYAAWPTRLYPVGLDRHVVYAGVLCHGDSARNNLKMLLTVTLMLS